MSVTWSFIPSYVPELDKVVVDVVDIGANPIDGQPPYRRLLDAGRARVVGFEPAAAAYEKLQRAKGPRETYFRLAVGDGREHTLHVCSASGMTSLLEPNQELLRRFHGFETWADVVGTEQIATVGLDDIDGIGNIDMLKIDVQGFELEVFKHGEKKLDAAVLIQTEVEFLPLYKSQPLFADVDTYLRSRGFVLHRFWPLKSRAVRPMMVNQDKFASLGQVFDADAVYIRDFCRFKQVPTDKLKALAVLLHDIYGSFDLVLLALKELDRRNETRMAKDYVRGLNRTAGEARFTLA